MGSWLSAPTNHHNAPAQILTDFNLFLFQGVCKNRPDKEDVPCTDCGKVFPSRRHLQEHRRTKHREGGGSDGRMMEQNMGHNLGQYLNVSRQGCEAVLPPFSRQTLGVGGVGGVGGGSGGSGGEGGRGRLYGELYRSDTLVMEMIAVAVCVITILLLMVIVMALNGLNI